MAVTGISANRAELLQIADAVAREKSIEREVVVEAIEEGHDARRQGALRQRPRHPRPHGPQDRRADADPRGHGHARRAGRERLRPGRLSDALKTDPQAFVDKEYVEVLPPMELGRVQTQMARQTGAAEGPRRRARAQFEEYKDRVTDIVNGTVKRVEYGNTIVDLGRGEGIMRRDQSIPRETFNIGDRIRCYIYDVRRS
jgi:N utilization substance protein A